LTAIAGRIEGISSGVLSQLYGGSYPGRYDLRCAVIAAYLADCEAARIYGRHDQFVPTRLAQGLHRLCERTRYNKRIQLLQSPEQLGKTTALRAYAADDNSRTLCVTCQDPGSGNPMSMLIRDLCEALGYSTDHTRISALRGRLRHRLSSIDLLVIDEFHVALDWPDKQLKALLNFLRNELHAEGRRGILCVATNMDIRAQLHAFSRRSGYNLGQIFGRACNDDAYIYPADIIADDVASLCRSFYEPGPRTLAKLHEVTARKGLGHFGFLTDILGQAWSRHMLHDEPINDALVEEILAEQLQAIARRNEN